MGKVALEPAAAAFAENAAKGTPAYQMNPVDARKILDNIQAAPIKAPAVDDKWVTIPASVGDVRVRIVRPAGLTGVLPTILYMHGGCWVLGNARTHDRLVRELSAGARAAVAFVEYTPSPDARYPVAIEQGYATARWVTESALLRRETRGVHRRTDFAEADPALAVRIESGGLDAPWAAYEPDLQKESIAS